MLLSACVGGTVVVSNQLPSYFSNDPSDSEALGFGAFIFSSIASCCCTLSPLAAVGAVFKDLNSAAASAEMEVTEGVILGAVAYGFFA